MKPLLLIAITILAVGCGGKDESTTETKSVEEKVLEVKEEAKTEEPLADTKPKLEGVNQDELERREGIIYLKGSDTPYTGKVFNLYTNGQKEEEGNYKDGKEDGLWTEWHKNGQKQSESNWKEGKEDGLEVWWHENGQKKSEVNYKDGEFEGITTQWHENGQKKSEVSWEDGDVISDGKFWNSKGERVDSLEEAK